MKNLYAFVAAMFVFAVSGCTTSDVETVQPLTVSETTVILSSEEDEVEITVTAPGEWSATSSDDEWCFVSQSGNVLSISAPKNYLTDEREATVTVESGEEQVEISVTQEAGEGYNAFSVTSENYANLPTTGGTGVSITSAYTKIPLSVKVEDENCDWSVEVVEGEDFITVPYILQESSDKTFDITIEANVAAEAREGKVRIWSEYEDLGCVYTLAIKQAAGTGELYAFQVVSTKYADIPKTGGISLTMPYRACEIPLIVAPTVEYYTWSAEVVEGEEFIAIPELTDVEEQKSFKITLAENPTTEARTAKVKIWSEYKGYKQEYEIALTQQLSQYTALQVFPKDDEIKVMSFNVWVNRSGEHAWGNRMKACLELIRYHHPAIIGLQESQIAYHWNDLKTYLYNDGYRNYGVSVEYGPSSSSGGTNGILYDANLLEVLGNGTFWLSETPDVPSKSWNSTYTRAAAYILFKHKHTGKTICYINTHLDHAVHAARVGGMQVIMAKFEEIGKDCDYWISTGDYNTTANNAAFNAIKGKLKNTRSAAPAGKTDNDRTYNGANETSGMGGPIDHILCSEAMEVVEYHTIDDDYGVPYVSDHYPVYAIMKL